MPHQILSLTNLPVLFLRIAVWRATSMPRSGERGFGEGEDLFRTKLLGCDLSGDSFVALQLGIDLVGFSWICRFI